MSRTVNDKLADANNRHTVYLIRWARSTYNKHRVLLDEAQADIASQLSTGITGEFTETRLRTMLSYAENRSQRLYEALQTAVNGDLSDLADYEGEFQTEAVQSAYPILLDLVQPSGAQIHAAALGRPFQGKLLREWWQDQDLSVRRAYRQALRLGYVEGESIQQISRRLKDIGGMERRQVETIIRTAVNHYSQIAREQVTQDNAELFQAEEWSAVLDGRTTLICASRDGKRYEIGKGPKPPAHMNCRSVRIPITKSWSQLGFDDMPEDEPLDSRPFVADKRPLRLIPKDQRAQVVGTTTARSYGEWLRDQPKSFVEDVLGQKKAKLFLDGNLSIDKFVDRQGTELTLDQLRRRERQVFNEVLGEAD